MNNTLGIQLAWIVVKDLKKAIEFYTNTVGLNLQEYHAEFGWAELSGPDGATLGISQESPQMDEKAGTNAVITVSVKDLEQALAEFVKKGAILIGEILEIPEHVKMQTFLDNDGNKLQIVQKLGYK